MEVNDHTGLRFELQVPCITGSQENPALSMNEDRKSQPAGPPEAI